MNSDVGCLPDESEIMTAAVSHARSRAEANP